MIEAISEFGHSDSRALTLKHEFECHTISIKEPDKKETRINIMCKLASFLSKIKLALPRLSIGEFLHFVSYLFISLFSNA